MPSRQSPSQSDPSSLRQTAFAHRDAQRTQAAFEAIQAAAQGTPDDPLTAFAYAQIAYETGRPCLDLFARALALNPGHPVISRNLAAALAQDGQTEAAIALLNDRLHQAPDWIPGHVLLANITRGMSAGGDPSASFAKACHALRDNQALVMAWFQMLANARDWDKAAALLAEAEARQGPKLQYQLARLYVTSESGLARDDAGLFDGLDHIVDPGLDLCRTRHFLRLGLIDRAEIHVSRHVSTPQAPLFWPYQGLIWRIKSDPRAHWLDQPEALIKTLDLGLSPKDLKALAKVLHGLHGRGMNFLEQSVRGGTQTDGQLLHHHHPAIQSLRLAIDRAVRAYLEALPAHDDAHPVLGLPRDGPVLFEGSWSVRLAAEGYHSTHTHPKGWISSALYVDSPAATDLGPAPAGWLELGAPPPELGLKELGFDLPAYRHVPPEPGTLILFPSTMWHGTRPFQSGSRLTIAFDVRRPGGG